MPTPLEKQYTGLQLPETYLAVVSPCSGCANQLAQSQNGMPACPRQAAILQMQDLQNNNISSANIVPLTLTGNEDNPNSSNTGLVNPVYSQAYNSILVWVAALKDNQGIFDENGVQLCPDLNDPNFNTAYIQCKPLPVTPRAHEADYFSKGGWQEWDQIEVNAIKTPLSLPDPNNPGQSVNAPIEGSAKKINIANFYPQQPVFVDHSVDGT
jgi:hypothetical protein